MDGDSGNVPDTAATGYYCRYYNLRSNGGLIACSHTPARSQEGRRKQSGPPGRVVPARGEGGDAPAGCELGGWSRIRLADGPDLASVPLRRFVLTLALAATLVLSLGMAGMYINIRMLHKQFHTISNAVDETMNKMAEITREQEVLFEQLYEHLSRAEGKLHQQMETLLQKEMWLRDNDRTGLVDFALESADATPRYDAEDSTLSFLGIPLFQASRSNPAAILQPDMNPGSCWSFRGSRGVAVVSLLGFVHVSAVSLEHIPASQAPNGIIWSAPRDFTVLALRGPRLREHAVELGQFVYRKDGHALQMYRIPVRLDRSIRYVALRIDSNHGHPNFTCVYRFRVHGSLDHKVDMLLGHESTSPDLKEVPHR